MRKLRKGRLLLIVVIALAIIAVAVALIINVVNKGKVPGGPGSIDDTQQVIPLPETTYSEMEVRNIAMEYLKNNDETMVSMEIHNTTQNKVENESLTAILLDKNGDVKGQMPTWIQELNAGEQYQISVILQGDLTSTTQIKLVENE